MTFPRSPSRDGNDRSRGPSPGRVGRDDESGDLKRKASPDRDDHFDDGDSPKRLRRDSRDEYRRPPYSPPQSQRRRFSIAASDDRTSRPSEDPSHRKPASAEDKKRGRRLFGGMLSTLSQKSTDSQQKRRQEIEKRQQERLQQQRAAADAQREEKVARITKVRNAEQIGFEEKVMRRRHAQMEWQARHLKTRAHPHIFYSPWKLTKEEEREIDDQILDTKALIKREEESFRARKARHEERHGLGRTTTSPPPESSLAAPVKDETFAEPPIHVEKEGGDSKSVVETELQRPEHDDSHEIVMETNEDTVIY